MTCDGGRLVLCCCWNKSPTIKLEMRRLYLVSAGRNLYVRTLCSRYVCTWYQPTAQIRTVYDTWLPRYVCTCYQPADERSARGRTSDDSYMYQLSLVVATATAVSLIYICTRIAHHFFFSSRRRHTRLPLVSWARRCV